jgi:hypothetical protein
MVDIADRNNISGKKVARIFDHVYYSNSSLPEVLSFDEFIGNQRISMLTLVNTNIGTVSNILSLI